MPDSAQPLVQLVLALPAGPPVGHQPLPPGLTLRSGDPGRDLPIIAELFNTVFGRSGEEAVTAERVARFARHPGISPDGVFLIFDGELAVGLGVGRLAMRSQGGRERRGAVELLAVRAGYRGRGLAHALLHAILGWLAAQGIRTVEASTGHAAAIHLLKQHGFTEQSADPLPTVPEPDRGWIDSRP